MRPLRGSCVVAALVTVLVALTLLTAADAPSQASDRRAGAVQLAQPSWPGARVAGHVRARAADATTPNDPGFAGCESQDPVSGCRDNEQWNLYGRLSGDTCLAPGGTVPNQPHPDGGLPCWALHARDPQHAAGVNMTGAWAQGNLGRNDVLRRLHRGRGELLNDGIKDALDNIYLNAGELPYPESADGRLVGTLRPEPRRPLRHARLRPGSARQPAVPGRYRAVRRSRGGHDPELRAGGKHAVHRPVDVGGDPRPYLSPEDLIAVFGHCRIVRGIASGMPAGRQIRQRPQRLPERHQRLELRSQHQRPADRRAGLQPRPGPDLADRAARPTTATPGVGVLPGAAGSFRSSRPPRPSAAPTTGPSRSSTRPTSAPRRSARWWSSTTTRASPSRPSTTPTAMACCCRWTPTTSTRWTTPTGCCSTTRSRGTR